MSGSIFQQLVSTALNQTTKAAANAFAPSGSTAAGATNAKNASTTSSGANNTPSGMTAAGGQATSSSSVTAASGNITPKDFRIRLSPFANSATQVYGASSSSNILSPLYVTNGLMFPYTPQITVTQDVTYQDLALTHTNSDFLAYTRTPSVNISISGKFTVQTQAEGIYALACIHFLRTVSKMYFGETDAAAGKAGLPPPILLLNGYGTYMFNNLRVVLKSHTYTYNEQMDTVLVSTAGGTAKLPALFDLAVTLVVQQTPRAQKKDFSLDAFRTGALMLKGGWI